MSSLVVHGVSAAMEEIIGISSSFHVKERCFEGISIFGVFTGIDNFFCCWSTGLQFYRVWYFPNIPQLF